MDGASITSIEVVQIRKKIQYEIAKYIKKSKTAGETKIVKRFKKLSKEKVVEEIEFLYNNLVIELAEYCHRGEYIYQLNEDDDYGELALQYWKKQRRDERRETYNEIRGWVTTVIAVLAFLLSVFSIIWQYSLHFPAPLKEQRQQVTESANSK